MFLSGYTPRAGRVRAKHSAGSDSSARLGVATEQVDTVQDTLRVGSREWVPRVFVGRGEGLLVWASQKPNPRRSSSGLSCLLHTQIAEHPCCTKPTALKRKEAGAL